MSDKMMYNPKFALLLFSFSLVAFFTIWMGYSSVVPIVEGEFGAFEILLLLLFLGSLSSLIVITAVLSRSFLILFDRGDHYILFGSFPGLRKRIVLDEHYQITEREYFYDTGQEEKVLRHLVLTDGLRTHRIVMLPVRWIRLIEERENRVRKRRVGLGEPPVFTPIV